MPNNRFQRLQLFLVNFCVYAENAALNFFRALLFGRAKNNPQKILIYKIGNIGDIICAIPAMMAIRRFYPQAKITLLTSPGGRGAVGAKELLEDVWYLDDLKIYYREDIGSWPQKRNFIKSLKKENFDLFIQLPDDLADFRTLWRNMLFAKLIGVRRAFGFKIRTIQLFKKTQVDYWSQKTEADDLIDLLKENGIAAGEIEFDLGVSEKERKRVVEILKKRGLNKGDILVAMAPGGKRVANRWPGERFGWLAQYLYQRYNAKIAVLGGREDRETAQIIKGNIPDNNFLLLAGEFNFGESLEFLKNSSFLIANSTGMIHLGAAAGIPIIGLYTIRDIPGRWFPRGKGHKIILHKFLDCDYRSEECIRKSIEKISVEEVKQACDELMEKII